MTKISREDGLEVTIRDILIVGVVLSFLMEVLGSSLDYLSP